MLSPRKLAPLLALSSVLSLALIAGTARAGGEDQCLIRSSQSRTQLYASLDDSTCSALAEALAQNGLQFSVAQPGTLEFTSMSELICRLTFVGDDEVANVHISIYDPGYGVESQALCQTFERAGFDLDPDFHWGEICSPALASGTQAGAIAALMTCGPSGLP